MSFDFSNLKPDSDEFKTVVRYVNKMGPKTEEEQIELGKALKNSEGSRLWHLFKPIVSLMAKETPDNEETLTMRAQRFHEFILTPAGKDTIRTLRVAAEPLFEVEGPESTKNFEIYNMLNLFNLPSGIPVEDIPAYKELNDRKKSFFNETFPEFARNGVVNQCRENPLIRAAVSQLADSYDNWTLDPQSFNEAKLKTQQGNLLVLSALIDELSEIPGMKELSLLEMNQKFESAIKGEIAINNDQIEEIRNNILSQLVKIQDEKEKPIEPLAKPTASVINRTIGLFRASNEALAQVSTQREIEVLGTSQNPVSAIKKTPKEPTPSLINRIVGLFRAPAQVVPTTIGFFKSESHVGTPGAISDERTPGAIMETLMYKTSEHFGDEDAFVPTREMSVSLAPRSPEDHSKYISVLNEEGEIVKKPVSHKFQGSFQPVEGMTLGDAMDHHPKEIARLTTEKVAEAIIRNVVYGMPDAHGNNVLVHDGNIFFFDNTRNMSTSNGVIFSVAGHVIPALRSGLLELPQTAIPLTPEIRAAMKRQLARYSKENIDRLEAYLKDPIIQKTMIEELPAGWLDVDASIQAMRERVETLNQALDIPEVTTLRDLVLAASPEFKLFTALGVLSEKEQGKKTLTEEEKSNILGMVGMTATLEYKRILKKYDVAAIKKLANDPSVTFDQMVTTLLSDTFAPVPNTLLADPFAQTPQEEAAQNLMKELYRKASVDFKDLPERVVEKATRIYLDQAFEVAEIPLFDQRMEEFATLPQHFMFYKNKNSLSLAYKNASNQIFDIDLDIQTPGKFGIAGEYFTPFELFDALQTASDPTTPATALQTKLEIK